MFIPPHTMQLKANNTIFLDDANINNDSWPIISGDQPPLTDPKVRGSEKEIGMHNYLTSKRMNY